MAFVLAVAAFAVAAAGCGGDISRATRAHDCGRAGRFARAHSRRRPIRANGPTRARSAVSPARSHGQPSRRPHHRRPLPQLAPVATPAPATPASPDPNYDPTATMYRAFPKVGYEKPDFEQAVADILRERDTSQVPVLVEALRFYFDAERQELAASTLRSLTGQNFDRLAMGQVDGVVRQRTAKALPAARRLRRLEGQPAVLHRRPATSSCSPTPGKPPG